MSALFLTIGLAALFFLAVVIFADKDAEGRRW
jgi:hypothetical protein